MDIFFQASPNESSATSFLQSPLGILLITLIAGSVGGIISHFLQRRSQHKVWLLENRINTFSEFLKILEQCRANVSEYIVKTIKPPINDDGILIDAFKIYEPARNYSEIVRLLLEEKTRNNFSDLVTKHIGLHCSAKTTDRNEIIKARKEIQKILEQHLNYSTF